MNRAHGGRYSRQHDHRERHIESRQQSRLDGCSAVVNHEVDPCTQALELVLLAQHLHEVRAADQSACVAEEAHEREVAARLRQVGRGAVHGRPAETGCSIARPKQRLGLASGRRYHREGTVLPEPGAAA